MSKSLKLEADISGAARKLNMWADMAASVYGSYSGINAAIAAAPDKSILAVHHADEIRQQMALMSIIRTFALLDRAADLSLQTVCKFLRTDEALGIVAQSFAASEPRSTLEKAMPVCSNAIQQFLSNYSEIDWTVFGRLQSFRNKAISHIAWGEVDKFVRYGELEKLVRVSSKLSGVFTLMTSGLNDWPEEQIAIKYEDAYSFWTAAFSADLR